ncbi:LOW QUALITY PROTEIN: hypothetical protein HZS_1229 [Henneguya salminicola]|nr:LOW QUALITY PROTEIN: hypothetical protein HZS_1229 [Henneguya salminicola]
MDEFCANYQEEFVRNNMASKLLDMISVDYSPETCLEAATTINELIRNIRTDAISDEMSLFELSLSDSIFNFACNHRDGTINKLVDTISAADLKISNAISAATVLSNILNLQRCGLNYCQTFFSGRLQLSEGPYCLKHYDSPFNS